MSISISSALDIAIGVTFLLLLLSMIVSFANEVIAKMMKWRSGILKEGIGNLLSDPDGKALARLVYDHPMIHSLGRSQATGEKVDPSYIPAERFAQVLTEVIGQTAAASTASQGATRDGLVLERGGGEGPDGAARLSDNHGGGLSRTGDAGFPIPDPRVALKDARSLVATLPEGEARTTLLVLADRTKGKMDAFEESVAEWFDDGMDRVSGWYRRRVQKCLFALSVIVVVVLNINVFDFAAALRSQPQLTDEVAAMAQQFGGDENSETAALDPDAELVAAAFKQLDEMAGLPLGWDETPTVATILRSFPGWLVTAVLASLGAPFWFNFLGQLLDIRGSGKPPSKTKRNQTTAGNSAGG